MNPTFPSINYEQFETFGTSVPWDHDVFIGAIGFESRATKVFTSLARTTPKLVLAFDSPAGPATEENLALAEACGALVFSGGYGALPKFLSACTEAIARVASAIGDYRVPHVLIDISCFTRRSLAALLVTLRREVQREGSLRIGFSYTLAKYLPPSSILPSNKRVGPVHPSLAGWSLEPELPPAAIVGLGYEEGKAAGAVEYLEALPNVWPFVPTSPEESYEGEVREHNKTLLSAIDARNISAYDVTQPGNLFVRIEALVSGLVSDHNIVLLPFGPKIFFAVAVLIALRRSDVAVWAVSGEDDSTPVDRLASEFGASFSILMVRDVAANIDASVS